MQKPRTQHRRIDVAALAQAAAAESLSTPIRFHCELDAAVSQSLSDAKFRAVLLTAAVQHAGFVGAAWYRLSDGTLTPETELLEHPALQNDDVRQAIIDQALVAGQQRREFVAPHTRVRNLKQISMALPATTYDAEVIVLLATDGGSHPNHAHGQDSDRQEAQLHAARSLCRAFELRRTRHEVQTSEVLLRTTAALLELTGQIETAQTLAEAYRVLADSVRDHLDVTFTAVGAKPADRLTCRVVAVAGLAEFDSRSAGTRRLKAALDESLMRDEFTSWPALDEGVSHQTMAHRQLVEHNRVEAVASLPLRCPDGEVVGVVVVGGTRNILTSEALGFLQTLDAPAGTSLRAVRRAEGGRMRRMIQRMRSSENRPRLVSSLVITAAILLTMLIPMPYRMACPFVCEPVQSHFIVAPYDGVLETTMVQPGDTVEAGQLFARMDGREIRWELAGLMADSSRADKKRDVHLADEQIVDSILAGLEVDRLNSRRDLLASRLQSLEIRSRVDGVILSGSPDRMNNYPVQTGQKLYEVASLSPLRMEVAVPDVEIGHVRTGMPVRFRPDSDPMQIVSGSVGRIRPRSETVGDRNVFVVEVIMENDDRILRPGMTGIARIEGDAQPLGWNLFHKAFEYTVSRVLW